MVSQMSGCLFEGRLGHGVFRVIGHHLGESDESDFALLFEFLQGGHVSLGQLEVVLRADAVDLHDVDDIGVESAHAPLY